MSTIEDFESAPVGAIATNKGGDQAIKTLSMSEGNSIWMADYLAFYKPVGLEKDGFVLETLPSRPTTAREALELAWELAHPVKEGQVIPAGTRVVARGDGFTVGRNDYFDVTANDWDAENRRTLDPLPEPEPDWLDAPAVLARVDGWSSCADPQVFARHDWYDAPSEWRCNGAESYPWQDLRDVTPLYPKEDA